MPERLERAKYGAAAHVDEIGALPTPFPRTIGPNAMKYLQEVVESGLSCDMIGRFERAFEKEYGVKLGFMGFFVKAAVHALKKYPLVNASIDGRTSTALPRCCGRC